MNRGEYAKDLLSAEWGLLHCAHEKLLDSPRERMLVALGLSCLGVEGCLVAARNLVPHSKNRDRYSPAIPPISVRTTT